MYSSIYAFPKLILTSRACFGSIVRTHILYLHECNVKSETNIYDTSITTIVAMLDYRYSLIIDDLEKYKFVLFISLRVKFRGQVTSLLLFVFFYTSPLPFLNKMLAQFGSIFIQFPLFSSFCLTFFPPLSKLFLFSFLFFRHNGLQIEIVKCSGAKDFSSVLCRIVDRTSQLRFAR